jgi:hypothetical protein
MLVMVEEINQVFSMKDGGMSTRVVLGLPTGEKLHAEIEDAEMEKLLRARSQAQEEQVDELDKPFDQQSPQYAQPDVYPEDTPPAYEAPHPAETQDPSDPVVEWANLPEHILPISMKQVLADVGAGPTMPWSSLQNMVAEISRRLAEQAQTPQPEQQPVFQQVPQPPQPQPPQQPIPRVQPRPQPQSMAQQSTPIGQVMMNRPRPRRSVPIDEQGYPIVPGVDYDPGEVGMPNADEDGVGQM